MHIRRTMGLLALLTGLASATATAQTPDSVVIRRIYDEILTNGKAHPMLGDLCLNIGARLSGSPQAAKAVEWGKAMMTQYGFDRVWLQPVKVPHWVRGAKEECSFTSGKVMVRLNVLALGNSVGTGAKGISAEVIEVPTVEALKAMPDDQVRGRIVFFNKPMDPRNISPGTGYGQAGDIRRAGPSVAASKGAVAVLTRSLTQALDDQPHTGALRYDDAQPKIPAAALGIQSVDRLSAALKADPKLKIFLRTNCEMLPDADSYNVIGEITGSERPEEIVVVGGHLDSWDVGQGAHDDGTGVVQSIEALRVFKALGIKPKRTIRAVLFMNEENGLRGGTAYADSAKAKAEKHIAAIESDAGGFTPRGFGISAPKTIQFERIFAWRHLFKPYLTEQWRNGGGGADIGPLAPQGTVLIGLNPDGQRYFDLHHTHADTFDKVNKRELELGAAAMASLVYLLSQHGVE